MKTQSIVLSAQIEQFLLDYFYRTCYYVLTVLVKLADYVDAE